MQNSFTARLNRAKQEIFRLQDIAARVRDPDLGRDLGLARGYLEDADNQARMLADRIAAASGPGAAEAGANIAKHLREVARDTNRCSRSGDAALLETAADVLGGDLGSRLAEAFTALDGHLAVTQGRTVNPFMNDALQEARELLAAIRAEVLR